MLPGIRRELPVEGSAGKMSENTRNIQNDGKSTKNPSIDKRITKKKKSRLTINFKIVYKIDNMNYKNEINCEKDIKNACQNGWKRGVIIA